MLRSHGVRGCSFLGTDINPSALNCTLETLSNHQVGGVDLIRTDLLNGLYERLCGSVDVLVFNPPYVPTDDAELQAYGIARAWAGGKQGRLVIDRFLEQVEGLLSPGGHFFLVTIEQNDPNGIIELLSSRGLSGRVALTRAADEEVLRILHFVRDGER